MKIAEKWYEGSFFDDAPFDASDGATTSQGPLWHGAPSRWGHSMHAMCSYHGMFPAKLVHYFIQRYSTPGQLVADPFSGRGTTTLQARAENRRSFGNDLNPLAHVLTAAKSAPPSWTSIIRFVGSLERAYKAKSQAEPDIPEDIRMLFHKGTLRQLVFLRTRLLSKPHTAWAAEEFMLAGAIAGILHGGHRSDGSSSYLSISMPNTFSMSPQYVKKFIRENKLVRIDQDVFKCLRDKIARLYLDGEGGPAGLSSRIDAGKFLSGTTLRPASVDLLITSPPYLRVVNYGTSNWIRLWWLGLDDVGRQQGAGRKALDAELDHRHTYTTYCEFMLRIFAGVERVLNRNGVAVFVIGDVASRSGSSIALAEQVWADVEGRTSLRLLDLIEDNLPTKNKVSRIWGETRGRATERDCVLVLTKKGGEPHIANPDVDWDEPYKDAGPDAAHAWLRRRATVED